MKKRIADVIFEILVEQGVTDCFAVVGGGSMHMNNALGLNKNMNVVFNHHEQACAIAAESYARYSGNLAAVCVTSGPGATNTLTGVMGAWVDSLPMLVISGQVRYALSVKESGLPLRFRGSQEFDIVGSVQNMTKYAKMIDNPLNVKKELKKAIHYAMNGRRGPVWLDIPLDIQSAIVEESSLLDYENEEILPMLDHSCLNKIDDLLKKSKRPVILGGNGIVNSGMLNQFRSFAKDLNIPVVAAAIAADVFYYDYDKFYGLSGFIGPRTGNFVLQNADLIISLGTSMGFKTTGYNQEEFAPKAKIVMIDVDPYEVKKPGVRCDLFINADLHEFLEVASKYIQPKEVDKSWITYCDKVKKRFSVFEPARGLDRKERVCSYYFWEKYQEFETADSITVLGNNTAISSKLQIGIKQEHQRVIANNNCGSMGYDLPAAIGAAVAAKKQVICVTGDGSIMMNLQELQTIIKNKLPIKIVVFSNDGYNAFRQTCNNFFDKVYVGCDSNSGIDFPEFSKVADTFNYHYFRCKNNGEVDIVLKSFLEYDGSALLEVEQRLDDPINPKVMSKMNANGVFSTPKLQDMYPFIDEQEFAELMIDD